MPAIWKAVTMALCLSCSIALAEEATAAPSADVTLRDGQRVSCERFAAGHNYSLCFQDNPRFLTIDHAEISTVAFHSPREEEIRMVQLR